MPEAAVEEALASSSLPRMYIASACTREAGVTRAGLCGSIRRMRARARAPSRDKGMMAMIKIDSSTSHSQRWSDEGYASMGVEPSCVIG